MSSKKTYRFLDYRLDPAHRVIERAGELLPMPPKVVDTLIVLVENAGEVVDKETLFRTVWPDTSVVESSLTRNISLLRKTLAEGGNGETIIQTVSKRGYRFVPEVESVPEHSDRGNGNLSFPSSPVPATSATQNKLPRRALILAAAGLALAAVLFAVLLAGTSHAPARKAALTDADREYLIGRHFWSKLEPAEVERALQRFQKAAELQPNLALAYAGIADSHITMVTLAMTNRAQSLREARVAAGRAISLDPKLALPHASLGYIAAMSGLDLQTARREFERARELGFASTHTLPGYGDYLTWTGDLDGARKYFEHAKRIDPVSAIIGTRAARLEYFAHRYAHAVELLQEVLEREPSFAHARYYLALSYAFQGRTDAALQELRLVRLNPHVLSTDEAWIRSLSGDPRSARALLEERRMEVEAGKKKHTVLLIPAISVGDRDLAIRALEEMYKTHEVELLHLKVDPRLDPLRSDVRFQDVVKRVFTGG